MRAVQHLVILAALFGGTAVSAAQTTRTTAATTRAALPQIKIEVVLNEKHQKQFQATVTLNDKPLTDVTVTFFITRSFGNHEVGHDKADSDGIAQVAVPKDFPGGETGQLHVIATITDPAKYAAARGEEMLAEGVVIHTETHLDERSLSAPRAPLLLIGTIAVVLISVWGCYVYVARQLVGIFRDR